MATQADLAASAKEIERVTERIGAKRVAERDKGVSAYVKLTLTERKKNPKGVSSPPADEVAVVGVDGGRYQMFDYPRPAKNAASAKNTDDASADERPEPDAAHRGTHWREDKIGLAMTMRSEVRSFDPCPTLPTAFADPTRIAKLTRELKTKRSANASAASSDEQAMPSEDPDEERLALASDESNVSPTATDDLTKPTSAPPTSQAPPVTQGWQPEVVEKHFAATQRPWAAFGPMIATLAWELGFFEAKRKAFVGDGAASNWTLWATRFSSFTPILDVVHAINYVFAAAMAGRSLGEGWPTYLRWVTWVWQGEVEKTIAEMALRQAELGAPESSDSDTHPRVVVATALGYLQRHKDKIRYAEYPREGLPITSSYVESAVKQFNRRVKGTEKFWTAKGAEALLQLRADMLSPPEVLESFWRRRQNSATGQNRYAAKRRPRVLGPTPTPTPA